MSWEDLWKFFGRQSKAIQQDVLQQLDLSSWIDSVSSAVRIEILKFAPVAIKRKYNHQVEGQKSTKQLQRDLNRIFK